MTFEVAPPVSEQQAAAVRLALRRAGVELEPSSPLYDSAWRRHGLREATGLESTDEPEHLDGSRPAGDSSSSPS